MRGGRIVSRKVTAARAGAGQVEDEVDKARAGAIAVYARIVHTGIIT